MSRGTSIVDLAKKRQPFCSRCLSEQRLHAHHMVAIFDGGLDEIENLDVICYRCHKEWHKFWEGDLPYLEFIETIPAHILAYALIHLRNNDTMGLVKTSWKKYRSLKVGTSASIENIDELRLIDLFKTLLEKPDLYVQRQKALSARSKDVGGRPPIPADKLAEILELKEVGGFTNKQIAQRVGVAASTIYRHMAAIRENAA